MLTNSGVKLLDFGLAKLRSQATPNWTPMLPRRRERKPRASLDRMLQALMFDVMQDASTLAEYF
jgi:hypothetical protein